MGLILQAVVTSSFPTMNISTLEAFKDNFLYGGIWSAMLIGIAVMLGICYLDYSILVKWSFPIWVVMQIPAVFSIISKIFFDETMWIGPMVNGRCYCPIWSFPFTQGQFIISAEKERKD